VAIQMLGFAALVGAPARWRVPTPRFVRLLGTVLMAVSGSWLVYSYRSLGTSHSPWVAPTPGTRLATTGAYALARHPIYAGWTALAFGWGLLTGSPLAIAIAASFAGFYDRRSRVEERALEAAQPEYRAYRRRVRRFVPGIC
jgi:protein-S-isoprenylcysteine O-methyltransferase Ste14